MFNTMHLDDTVQQELNAFIVSLSHLPVGLQAEILRDATSQVSAAVEASIESV
jgi:hypothetical protein